MALAAGANEQAGRLLEQAIVFHESTGDTHAAARVSCSLAYVDSRAGRREAAIARTERAYAVIAADEPDATSHCC